MHEAALIEYVLDSIERSARQRGVVRVLEIHLVLGKINSALPHALEFAFTALSQGSPLFEEARLCIEARDVRVRCSMCGAEHSGGDPFFSCPACSSSRIELLSGDELYIDYYEGEEEADGSSEGHRGREGRRGQ